METTFSTPGIACEDCAGAIKRALGAVPGVAAVSVDVAAKTVRVTHDDGARREAVAAALAKAGYPPGEPRPEDSNTPHRVRTGEEDTSRNPAGGTVKDPVCGMTSD